MKNNLTLIAIALSFTQLTYAADEEYRYIEVPQPNQIADLQDDDRDGVINARDICADTIRGAHVDNDGCATHFMSSSKMQLKILFANNSDKINSVFMNEINNMVDFLKQHPQTSIELKGYASKVGNSEHNMSLSKNRANQVKDSLVNAGVEFNRVTITGYGDTSLENSGDSEQSHATNRKVVATVVGYDDKILNEWNIFSKRKK